MNIKLIRKLKQRLEDLEQKADSLKDQIINLGKLNHNLETIKKEEIQSELRDTLNKINHINSVNKNF
ncbi:MAG: hypothetical protein HRT87_08995 [Legionellales bacterium]|nr:hypothetical protein [Legionellales bacterium]